MLYDTHCHPNLAKNKNAEEIIKNFFEENSEGFLNIIGTDLEKSKQVLELSTKNSRTFCSIGIHPCDVYGLDLEKSINILDNLYLENKEKIIAIGETGLDYYWEKDKKEEQKTFFKAQIELAKKYNLPVIIHNRESKDDIFDILVETNFKNFIFHCFSENLEYAEKLIEFSPNCKISFSGIVTFKNAKEIQETAQKIPLKNILVETDSPYLTPTPFRGKCENEPTFTKYVLEKIIELRDENPEEIKKTIFENSCETFLN
ncbi:MAG: TatD family hydrolase [Candidatus Gracilibacteria bacterium]|nr:TatD family hydrolase [Candidatus Gracilibacteria bacterium]